MSLLLLAPQDSQGGPTPQPWKLDTCPGISFAVQRVSDPSGYWHRFSGLKELSWFMWNLQAGTPISVRIQTPHTHKLGLQALTLVLRAGSSDLRLMQQHICYCELCRLQPLLPLPVRNVSAVLDLGANIGLSALALSIIYPKATVVALEPGPSNFLGLTMNTGRSQSIQAVYGAAWSSNDLLALNGSLEEPGRRQAGGSDWATAVGRPLAAARSLVDAIPAFDVGHLMRKHGLHRGVDLIKVDIEGSEGEVFGGDPSLLGWLQRVRCLLMEWHHAHLPAQSYARFKATMGRYNFQQLQPQLPLPAGQGGQEEGGEAGAGGGGDYGGYEVWCQQQAAAAAGPAPAPGTATAS